jgi:hypothetical protein
MPTISDDVITLTPPPWRLLVLDREPADAKWLLLEVPSPQHVWPADLDAAGRYRDWTQTAEWVRRLVGVPASLSPVHDGLVWSLSQARPRLNPSEVHYLPPRLAEDAPNGLLRPWRWRR